MKPIILCADDYGLSKSVGVGIRQLAAARRLSAVSCMSSALTWPAEAALLQPLRDKIDVGLHFNLTQGFGESSVTDLAFWIISSLAGSINKNLIEREFIWQLDRFESVWGEPPDFVDGHQHVHIFPGIRNVVFRLLEERYSEAQRPWIRQVNPSLTGHDAPSKALILRMLSTGFVKKACLSGLDLSSGFAGLYSLSAQANFPAMMAGWLHHARPGTVLMCHPGIGAAGDPDSIGQARMREFQYLRGPEFEQVCKREMVAIVRFCRQSLKRMIIKR